MNFYFSFFLLCVIKIVCSVYTNGKRVVAPLMWEYAVLISVCEACFTVRGIPNSYYFKSNLNFLLTALPGSEKGKLPLTPLLSFEEWGPSRV